MIPRAEPSTDLKVAPGAPDADAEALRRQIQRFIRQFGLLANDRTPCGKPLAVSHAHALMVLLEQQRAGRRPTQQDLGRALGIDKSNVARLSSKMVAAGQLVQDRSSRDGRLRLLRLTDRGARLAVSVERSSQARFREIILGVCSHERRSVLSALLTLNESLARSTARQEANRRPLRPVRPRRSGKSNPARSS